MLFYETMVLIKNTRPCFGQYKTSLASKIARNREMMEGKPIGTTECVLHSLDSNYCDQSVQNEQTRTWYCVRSQRLVFVACRVQTLQRPLRRLHIPIHQPGPAKCYQVGNHQSHVKVIFVVVVRTKQAGEPH